MSLILLLVAVPYAAAAVGYLEARRRAERPPTWARILGLLTVVAHIVGLVVLSMERARSPFQTESQALSFLAFALAAIYVLLELTSGIVEHGGGFHLLATILTSASIPGLAAESVAAPAARARDPMLAYHIGLALLGTAAIVAAGLLAAGYLRAYRRMKDRQIVPANVQTLSLFSLQRLARDASFAGLALLLPSVVLGAVIVEQSTGTSHWVHAELGLGAAQCILTAVAAFLWWRRPRRGAAAAYLNVAATILAVATFAVVHPLLVKAMGAG